MKKAILLAIFWALPVFGQSTDELLSTAYSHYVAGETTDAAVDRQAAFNNALALYSKLEADHPHSLVNYNLGNCYFQLGQYPWAILYYKRALTQSPRDRRILGNLAVAEERAGIQHNSTFFLLPVLLYPHQLFSVAERRTALAWLTLIAVVAGSWMIWRQSRWPRRITLLTVGAAVVVIVSLSYSEVLSTPQAVIVESTPVYKDAGEQYATVGSTWTLAGTTVTVLGFAKEHSWAEIEDKEGQRGFVPEGRIRVI